MACAKIRIEYNGYTAPGFTEVNCENYDDYGDLQYEFNLDDSDEVRKYNRLIKRLDLGETIRLVSEVGACNTRITCVAYYLFTRSGTDHPDIKEWLDNVRKQYDVIATDGENETIRSIYNKRWPGTEDLGCPRGFEHAEDIEYLDCGSEDEDED